MNEGVNACGRFEDAVVLLAGGDLPEAEAAPVRAHLARCAGCARVLAETRAALAWAQDAAEAPFDDTAVAGLHARVVAAVAAAPVPRRSITSRLVALFPSGRLALLAAGAAGALLVTTAVRHPDDIGARDPLLASAVPDAAGIAPAFPGVAAPVEAPPPDDADVAGPSHALKIELRTRDPKIRIIWLADR